MNKQIKTLALRSSTKATILVKKYTYNFSVTKTVLIQTDIINKYYTKLVSNTYSMRKLYTYKVFIRKNNKLY